ncbi:MAG: Ubiquinone/menaquinone biosynthesis C-methyltransferase UbiE [Phycisphaerae bacterium]|nr:Ubiquinone/menaquinone biosynthesis C-methyltransferase UbiE [Phycisphaerae bacterium]
MKPKSQSSHRRPVQNQRRASKPPAISEKATSSTSWDHVAQWYDQLVGDEGSDYHQQVVLPAALQLMQPIAGQRVLDICCGQGVLCRRLVEAGAAEVTGVDISPRLIASAKQREKKSSPIRYLVGDATKLDQVLRGSFDAAASLLALHDLENIGSAFHGAASLLKKGGRLVVVIMHPCFRIPRQSSWEWDEQKKVQYRRLDRYFTPMQIPIATHPGREPGEQTKYFHRPLMAYLQAMGQAGMWVDRAEELLSHRRIEPGGRSRGINRSAEEFPIFLALRAIKSTP